MTDRNVDVETMDLGRDINSPDRNRQTAFEYEPGFDDGLVHDHGWACRERSAPAY